MPLETIVWIVSVGNCVQSVFLEVVFESCTQIVQVVSCLESVCFE